MSLLFLVCCLLLLFPLSHISAHRDGCHRWHSCPSDTGSYTCGDLGHCAQCTDNAYCARGQPRQAAAPAPASSAPADPPTVAREQFTGKVVGLSDGDTFQILREGKAVKVRLHGIDTPEKAQPFGARAQQYASELVFQQMVTVQIKDTDRYGRLVGEVLLQDGRSVNQELVKAGMAWWYKQYAPNDTTLAQLEEGARATQRGLWADAHPVPPWDWRKR
jgi:endonuclease YncB( thermonuclease family)